MLLSTSPGRPILGLGLVLALGVGLVGADVSLAPAASASALDVRYTAGQVTSEPQLLDGATVPTDIAVVAHADGARRIGFWLDKAPRKRFLWRHVRHDKKRTRPVRVDRKAPFALSDETATRPWRAGRLRPGVHQLVVIAGLGHGHRLRTSVTFTVTADPVLPVPDAAAASGGKAADQPAGTDGSAPTLAKSGTSGAAAPAAAKPKASTPATKQQQKKKKVTTPPKTPTTPATPTAPKPPATGTPGPTPPVVPVPPTEPAPAGACSAAAPPAPLSTYPDASTTGVPSGTPLRLVVGDFHTSQPGQVVTGLDITGKLYVDHDNVTVTCSRIHRTTINGGKNLRMWFSSLGDARGVGEGSALKSGNYLLRRVDVQGTIDGLKAEGDVDVRDCYIHDLYYTTDSGQPGGWSHNDGVQIGLGSHMAFVHNTFFMWSFRSGQSAGANLLTSPWGDGAGYATSAFMVIARSSVPISDVLIQDNLIRGRTSKYIIVGPNTSNVRILDNLMGRENRDYPRMFGADKSTGTTIAGNVSWDSRQAANR